jgi:CheY-like chemotaxis protein/signal transduction histidine kinase
MHANMSRPARLASFGLGAVLLVLTTFAVVATLVTNRAVNRVSENTTLSAAYESARFAVGEEESLERKYRLEPGPDIRVRYRAAVDGVLAAMHEVARTGGKRDVAVARKVLRLHRPYLAAIGRMFDAVDRHDTRLVLRIDSREVDPSFGQIETLVSEAAARQRTASADALSDSATVSRHVVWQAPAVFGAGLALLAFLWLARRREQRAAAARLERDNELLAHQAERLRRTLAERELAEGELAETQERLRHAQRLESVGELAGGVAHDFNNLLQVILGYCGLLEATGARGRSSRDRGDRHGGRARRRAPHQLLAFGRRQTMKPAVWDVNAIVANVESMLTRILPGQIDFKALPSGELRARRQRAARAGARQPRAERARRDAGRRTLTIFTEPLELDRPPRRGRRAAGGLVRPDRCPRQRLRDERRRRRGVRAVLHHEGARPRHGLGLSTVYGIVRQSGGFVSLDSTLGVGTEVAVCLPRTLEAAALQPVPGAAKPSTTAGVEQVLLVEDNLAVRTVLASYLREQGHAVLEAADGLAGLETFREHHGRIGVVVTDVVMPNLDGWALVNELRRTGETVPIVVMSGFSGEAQRTDDRRLEQLTKPFAPVEVSRAIARLIARSRQRTPALTPPTRHVAGMQTDDETARQD